MVVRSIRARSLFSIFLYLAKHDMSYFYLFFVARFNVFTFSYIHSNHYHFFFVFTFKSQEYHSLIPQKNYSKTNTGTLDNCRDKILTKYREAVQDKTDRHKDNFFFEYPLRACCKFEGGMKQGLRLIMSRSSAISCKYIREDETAVVRGVRAWSSRMSLLFHVSLISLKSQEY